MKKITWSVFVLLVINFSGLFGQDKDALSAQELEKFKQQVTSLTRFLESTMNFLGDPKNIAKEKETIITESYLKMFVNNKVQIEDDLDEARDVPLYKDVQAYLKDIGFFYRRVKFEFVIADITHYVNDQKQHYFKVTFNRSLNGLTVTRDSVSSRKVRFMEVNLDINASTLKIASIYTTKLDEREEIKAWWNNLTATWKTTLGKNVYFADTIELSRIDYFNNDKIIINTVIPSLIPAYDTASAIEINLSGLNDTSGTDTLDFSTEEILTRLKGILNQKNIDVSGNHQIKNLSPLTEMTELREINCQNTMITDLFPIRNLNYLEILNFSETPVDDILPLLYTTTLKQLNCGFTLINDLSPIAGLVNMEQLVCEGIKITNLDFISQMNQLRLLDCSHSRIYDLSPIEGLDSLKTLDISATSVISLDLLAKLSNLTYLNCESTSVSSLDPLANLFKLEVLRISNSDVNSLVSLKGMKSLKRIYCDNTEIPKAEAIQYMKDHPECLVIFESEDLLAGWKNLESPWKEIIKQYFVISEPPSQEELHQVITVQKLDISGNKSITTLQPVKRLFNLKYLDISSVNLKDFTPVSEVFELEELNLSGNSVTSIDFLSKLSRLRSLNIQNTNVISLAPIENISTINIIYADSSGIEDAAAFNFREKNPGSIVVYKTNELNKWWNTLPVAWKNFFAGRFKIDSPPAKEQLHHILFLDSLTIRDNNQINDLSPVAMLKGLKKLSLSGTQVSNLSTLSQLKDLEILQCNQSPVNDLTPLSGLSRLSKLDFENTPVEKLDPITGLLNLKSLNCSGTQIKSINPVSGLLQLEEIKINNTSIKSLKPLLELPGLKSLECYNTGISSKNVEKFKEAKPGVKVIYY